MAALAAELAELQVELAELQVELAVAMAMAFEPAVIFRLMVGVIAASSTALITLYRYAWHPWPQF